MWVGALTVACGGQQMSNEEFTSLEATREAQRVEYEMQADLEQLTAERLKREAMLLEQRRRAERDRAEEEEQRAREDEQRAKELERRRQLEEERSTARRYAAQLRAAEEAFSLALSKAREEMLTGALKKRGLLTLSHGLEATLTDMVQSAIPLTRLKKVAIQLTVEDSDLKVSQVIGNTGLVHAGDLKLLVPGKSGSIYQGTLVTELGATTYKVVELVTYRSLLGLQQAFRLQPIDHFDIEDAAWLAVLEAMVREDNTLTLATVRDDILHECVDLRVGKNRKWKAMEDTIAVERPCTEAFQRPVLGRCKHGPLTVYGYPGQMMELGVERACATYHGEWTPGSELNVVTRDEPTTR